MISGLLERLTNETVLTKKPLDFYDERGYDMYELAKAMIVFLSVIGIMAFILMSVLNLW
jgi:hypothetical protein